MEVTIIDRDELSDCINLTEADTLIICKSVKLPKLKKVNCLALKHDVKVSAPNLEVIGQLELESSSKLTAKKLTKLKKIYTNFDAKLIAPNNNKFKLLATYKFQLWYINGRYIAGCRNFTKNQALKHWKEKVNLGWWYGKSQTMRAKKFIKAIEQNI